MIQHHSAPKRPQPHGLHRHYGNDNFTETAVTTIVSVNLAFLQLADDNNIETGQ